MISKDQWRSRYKGVRGSDRMCMRCDATGMNNYGQTDEDFGCRECEGYGVISDERLAELIKHEQR